MRIERVLERAGVRRGMPLMMIVLVVFPSCLKQLTAGAGALLQLAGSIGG